MVETSGGSVGRATLFAVGDDKETVASDCYFTVGRLFGGIGGCGGHCQIAGSNVVVIAKLLGATPEIICSLAPKSVTTPIAMEVSKATGGIPSLTAAVVVVVGLFGAVFGFKVLRVGHVGSPIAQGLSMGTATHAVGTSTAMEISGKYGAYASLGLTLNGIMTAIFTPTILRLLGVI